MWLPFILTTAAWTQVLLCLRPTWVLNPPYMTTVNQRQLWIGATGVNMMTWSIMYNWRLLGDIPLHEKVLLWYVGVWAIRPNYIIRGERTVYAAMVLALASHIMYRQILLLKC